MRSLKRPLSILIAALILVSVMVIAPVTASATVTASGTINEQGSWVATTYVETTDSAVVFKVSRASLKEKNIFARFYDSEAAVVPDWSLVTGYGNNKTVEFGLSNNLNMYSIENYYNNDENSMLGSSWDEYHTYNKPGTSTFDDENVYFFIYNAPKNHHGVGVQYFVWTYNTFAWSIEDGVLTVTGSGDIADYANASDVPWYSNIGSINSVVIGEGITGIGTNVLAGLYNKPVSLPSTLTSFDNIADYKNATISREGADPMSDFAPSTFKKLETLGVQERTVDNAAAFRFVTVADSGLLKAADDYGYIMASTSMSKDEAMSAITDSNFVVGSGTKKYSCKGTSNNFAGDYGSSDLTATGYKYISCIVTGAASGNVVVSRFYITLDGTTYTYAPYSTYNGCAYALS